MYKFPGVRVLHRRDIKNGDRVMIVSVCGLNIKGIQAGDLGTVVGRAKNHLIISLDEKTGNIGKTFGIGYNRAQRIK